LPPIKAVIDNPTFARIFTINETYWWFLTKLVESSARKDIVVNDPQNPIAVKSEYFPSRFHCCESTMNNPWIDDPITLANKTLRGIVVKINGDSVILYLKKPPSTDHSKKNKRYTFD